MFHGNKELDIDSKSFDSQKYVNHILQNNGIHDLIVKTNQVQQEVKNFDQEIQSLVFQNYSKFISSIDTVKKMKTDIFKVDDKMKILERSMEKITKLTSKIDDQLKVKREEIRKLETVNIDLQKLNSLCEFPKIMEKDLQQEIRFLFTEIEPHLSEHKQCTDLIDNTLKEIVLGILQQISIKLNEVSDEIGNIDINECLKSLNNNIQKAIIDNDVVKRTLKSEVQQKFNENIESVYKGQILKGFNSIRIQILQAICEMKQECEKYPLYTELERVTEDIVTVESDLKKKVFDLLTVFKNKINSYYYFTLLDLNTLIFYQSYLPNTHHFLSLLFAQTLDFAKAVIRLLCCTKYQISQEFVLLTNSAILNKQQLNNFIQEQQNQSLEIQYMHNFEDFQKQESSSIYFLVVNQFLQIYKQNMIGQIFYDLIDQSKNNIQRISEQEPSIIQYFKQYQQTLEGQEIPKLYQFLNKFNQKNSINYSQYHAQNLLKGYIISHIKQNLPFISSEPADISEKIQSVAYVWKIIMVELAVYFPDMKRGMQKKGSFLKFESEFDVDMQKMLVKKLHYYKKGVEEVSRNFVLNSIVNSFLKSLNEVFRASLKGVNKNTYMQIFFDMYFVMQIIYESVSVDDENLVIAFFFEIMENISEKCHEQLPSKQQMQNLVETVASTKRMKLKL